MSSAIFINQVNRYLHPSSLEVVDMSGHEDLSIYLGGPHIESVSTTSAFGRVDFWFDARSVSVRRDINRPATELLLASAEFAASSVPLLRGRVVLTSHDTLGGIVGLSDRQISQIALHANRWRGRVALNWRYAGDARVQRRRRRAHRAEREREFWEILSARN